MEFICAEEFFCPLSCQIYEENCSTL